MDDHQTQIIPVTLGPSLRTGPRLFLDTSLAWQEVTLGLAPQPGATDPSEGTWTLLIIQRPAGPKYRSETDLCPAPLFLHHASPVPQSCPACQVPKQLLKGAASSRGASKLFLGGSL